MEWVTTVSSDDLKKHLLNDQMQLVVDRDGMLVLSAEETLFLRFHTVSEKEFYSKLFETSCSEEFLNEWNAVAKPVDSSSEEKIFSSARFNYIPPYLRETKNILSKAKTNNFNDIVQTRDIKGLIHSHSNWSDGSYTIEEMASELINLGFEYLVISDHSKAAYYANGLTEQRIREQHLY